MADERRSFRVEYVYAVFVTVVGGLAGVLVAVWIGLFAGEDGREIAAFLAGVGLLAASTAPAVLLLGELHRGGQVGVHSRWGGLGEGPGGWQITRPGTYLVLTIVLVGLGTALLATGEPEEPTVDEVTIEVPPVVDVVPDEGAS